MPALQTRRRLANESQLSGRLNQKCRQLANGSQLSGQLTQTSDAAKKQQVFLTRFEEIEVEC